MVVVEPVVTKEKLLELLVERCELSCLDYKRQFNLGRGNTQDIVDLAKHIAAMQSEPNGGYIVVGADDHGNVVPDLSRDLARHFDDATLRPKLAKYLSEPEIRVARHDIDSSIVALIYVAPSDVGWCIFKANGEYEVDTNGKRRKEVIFRVGDVFVRHGTRSERWTDADRERLVSQIVARRKEAWLVEMRTELQAIMTTAKTVQDIEALPAAALTWRLDAGAFAEVSTELIRRGDDIPLRRLLNTAVGEAAELLGRDQEELRRLLDRLTTIAALAIQYERQDWLKRVVDVLVRTYKRGFDKPGYNAAGTASVWLWLDIVTRVYGLGALAVRLERWGAVRLLADRRPNVGAFDEYGSWLRHALTEAARARIFETEEKAGLLARAHNIVRSNDALHLGEFADDDAILNSLCQFDVYGCVIVIGGRRSLDSGNYYPNFARYYTPRSQPAFIAVVTEQDVRNLLFDGTDQLLADAIVRLDETAAREGLRYQGWTGLTDQRVLKFVERHQTQSK
ncbi:AlbA family DNA-binding domain-containing protein [Kibdelosporangium aridum]|uniref:ATP-binding protein n=1 Tax=Kibdelosporangium aridum TaxID=2030 RepID=A0A1W2DKY9_KIBAR|nr:hypothetical protein [Kibdelosporangium aridum]SMC98115.1 hypothetical protein SAMN05661093_03503 [Kibdelosporangium aridum]